MAVNAYLQIDGRSGPSTSKADAIESFGPGASQSAATQPATVQAGENSMGQVAGRLGVDESLLQQANPHIKDPSNLKAGQEIYLPTHQEGQGKQGEETEAAGSHHHHHHHAQELPNAPLGSSIEASMIKNQLNAPAGKKGDD